MTSIEHGVAETHDRRGTDDDDDARGRSGMQRGGDRGDRRAAPRGGGPPVHPRGRLRGARAGDARGGQRGPAARAGARPSGDCGPVRHGGGGPRGAGLPAARGGEPDLPRAERVGDGSALDVPAGGRAQRTDDRAARTGGGSPRGRDPGDGERVHDGRGGHAQPGAARAPAVEPACAAVAHDD